MTCVSHTKGFHSFTEYVSSICIATLLIRVVGGVWGRKVCVCVSLHILNYTRGEAIDFVHVSSGPHPLVNIIELI